LKTCVLLASYGGCQDAAATGYPNLCQIFHKIINQIILCVKQKKIKIHVKVITSGSIYCPDGKLSKQDKTTARRRGGLCCGTFRFQIEAPVTIWALASSRSLRLPSPYSNIDIEKTDTSRLQVPNGIAHAATDPAVVHSTGLSIMVPVASSTVRVGSMDWA
jgi:hypothetical protein